ncbi:hypothetical protein BaRGS_00030081 [Batillaria attramentaria]|uniref:Galaxin-like repeats domain-containing protein n=1 Tax=Batillaria attramentaria TaxID=370345 RepID=A0ABD0JVC1_9CAEN
MSAYGLTKQTVAALHPMTNTHICCDGHVSLRPNNADCCGTRSYDKNTFVVMVMSAYGLTMQTVAALDPMTNTHICCDGHVSLRPNKADCCGTRSYDKHTHLL